MAHTPRHRSVVSSLAVGPSSRVRVAWLFGPLALFVGLFKLIKYVILVGPSEGASVSHAADMVPTLILQHAPVPLMMAGGALFAVLLFGNRLPGLLTLPVFAAAFAGSGWALKTVMPYELMWLSWGFAEVLRWEVVGVLAAAAVAMLLLEHTAGWRRRGVLGVLHVGVPSLMLLAALEFGYFVSTGSLGDAFMLRYSIAHAADVSYVMSSQMSAGVVALLVAPVVFSLAPVAWGRFRKRRTERGRGASWNVLVLAVPALVLAFVPGVSLPEAAEPIAGNTFVSLTEDLFARPVWDAPELDALAADAAPLFDTGALRFVPTPDVKPMNVVVLILESQRHPDFLPEHVTPFLDGLRARSVEVEQMHAVVPHTNKALVPILCGIYPKIDQGESPAVPGRCLPHLLGAQGYPTAFFTPATLAFEQKGEMLANMGFEDAYGDGAYEHEGFMRTNYFGYEERIMLAPSLAWIDAQRATETPFFAAYLTLTPHHPYGVPEGFPRRDFGVADPTFDDYLNGLAYVDAFAQDLFAAFEERGMFENTVFLVLGDHGEAFGEHGLRYHSAVLWDEVLRVPAFIFSPALFPEGGTATGPRQQTDLLPTVAEMLGYRVEGGTLPGLSLLGPVPADRTLYHAGWIENQSMALRRGSEKHVYHYRRRPTQTYDLSADPFEQTDRAAEHPPERYEALELELLLWRRRVNERHEAAETHR